MAIFGSVQATAEEAIDAGQCTPAIATRSPALVAGGSLAYFPTRRSRTPGRWDLGAIGHDWAMSRQSAALTPEAAEVLTGLPSWVSRGLHYVIAVFVVVGLLWSGLSKVDVTVNARGTLVPEGYVLP